MTTKQRPSSIPPLTINRDTDADAAVQQWLDALPPLSPDRAARIFRLLVADRGLS